MDRDTVRLLLIVLTVVLLAGIYVWGRYRQPIVNWVARRKSPDLGEFEDLGEYDPGSDPDFFEEEIRVITPGTGARREPGLSGLDFRDSEPSLSFEPERPPEAAEPDSEPEPELPEPTETADDGPVAAPFLIQVSVIAGPGRFFNGAELKQALMDADLLFGDMGIFHRYNNDLTRTQFSVASLVEPGTFPIDDMSNFECPGIVLFFQTARVANPVAIYDDLINTSRELAHSLRGIQWDETRQPLNDSKIARMRNLLRNPVESVS